MPVMLFKCDRCCRLVDEKDGYYRIRAKHVSRTHNPMFPVVRKMILCKECGENLVFGTFVPPWKAGKDE